MKLTLNFAHPENKANSCIPGTRAAAVKANYVRMATKKKERNAGYIAATGAVRDLPPVDGKVQEFKPLWYRIVWYYKGVKPDADNIVARCKHVLDGCAFGFGVMTRRGSSAGCRGSTTRRAAARLRLFFPTSYERGPTEAKHARGGAVLCEKNSGPAAPGVGQFCGRGGREGRGYQRGVHGAGLFGRADP